MADSNWQRLLLQSKRAFNKPAINIIQNPIGIAGGVVSNALNQITTGEILENSGLEGLTFEAGTLKYSRYWRYRLLLKADNGMEKSGYNPRLQGLGNLGLSSLERANLNDQDHIHTTRAGDLSPAERRSADLVKIQARRNQREEADIIWKDYTAEKYKALERESKGPYNEVFIINDNVSPYIALKLQNRPPTIEINPHGTWASIQSMGRNNPFMMYTGGEDTLSFEVSWFANDRDHREEVLLKCRLLESWCKADGYMAAPPVLKIKWGTADIFKNCLFILESAPYKLTNFQDRYRRYIPSDGQSRRPSYLVDGRLYPSCATQQLTFKKVSMTNTVYEDIVPAEDLNGINGISFD